MYMKHIRNIIPTISAFFNPFFSLKSVSILFCSLSFISSKLISFVLPSTSFSFILENFGTIIFSNIIVPTIEVMIVAAIIIIKFEVKLTWNVLSINLAATVVSNLLPLNQQILLLHIQMQLRNMLLLHQALGFSCLH